jgi:Fe2+ transport system protein FeoA
MLIRHEAEETAAKNEIKLLEVLAELRVANAKQLSQLTGISYLSTNMALRRQQGIGARKITGGWQYMDEPGDGNESTHAITNRRKVAIETYLQKQGIKYTEIRKEKHTFVYTVETPVKDIQIGDLISIGKTHKGTLINRLVVSKNIKSRFTDLGYKQGAAIKLLTIKNGGTITTHHKILKTQIDQWRIELGTPN